MVCLDLCKTLKEIELDEEFGFIVSNKYLSSLDFFVKFELDEEFKETIKSRFRDEFNYKFTSFEEGIKKTWKLMNEKYNTTTLDG